MSNNKNPIANWQKEMYSAVRNAAEESKYDMTNLYLKLEQVSKKYLASQEMQEGDVFLTSLENGIHLKQTFFNTHSTLEGISKYRTQMIISSSDSYKKEYRNLDALTFGLEQSDLGIGVQYPEDLKIALSKMRPGQLFVCNASTTYVCLDHGPDHVVLKKLVNRDVVPKVKDINISDGITIGLHNDIQIQNFYSEVRSRVTDDVEFRWDILTTAQQAVNRINAGLQGKSKVIEIGPNTIHLKRGFLSNNIKWYDEEGQLIPEEKVLILLGWYQNAPIITEYKREIEDPVNQFNDEIVQREVDRLCAKHDFKMAANYMIDYCEDNHTELFINMSSYVKINEEFKAVGFMFKVDDNNVCKIFKLSFENNDIKNGEIHEMISSNVDEFKMFCEEKYRENHILIQCKEKDNILQQYPSCRKALLESISNRIADKKTLNSETVNSFEQTIEKAREDASLLAKSYINHKNKNKGEER